MFPRHEKYAIVMALIMLIGAIMFAYHYSPITSEYIHKLQEIAMYENVSCGIVPPEVGNTWMLIKRNCTEVCGESGCNYPNKAEILGVLKARSDDALIVAIVAPAMIFWVFFGFVVYKDIKISRRSR